MEQVLVILLTRKEDSPKHKTGAALRMGLAIQEGQSGAPGPAKYHPFLNAQMLSQSLNVCDRVLRSVLLHAGKRLGPHRASLIKHHDVPKIGIKKAGHPVVAAKSGASM